VSDAVLQTVAHLAQDLVPTLVSHTGVHLSEAVEIDEEHRVQVLRHLPGLLVLPPRPMAGAVQPLGEERPVYEVRDGVAQRVADQSFLGALSILQEIDLALRQREPDGEVGVRDRL